MLGQIGGRAEMALPAIKRFRLAARGANLGLNAIAYGTAMALAADNPQRAAYYRGEASSLPLSDDDLKAVKAVLASAGVEV